MKNQKRFWIPVAVAAGYMLQYIGDFLVRFAEVAGRVGNSLV